MSGEYAEATTTWHDEDAPFKARWIADLLSAERYRPRSVVDVGCGTGGVLAGLHARWPDATLVGYELAPDAIAMARRFHPEIEVREGDPRETQEHFDLAILADVFEHVEDYLGFLRSVSTLADRLICHIPLEISVQTALRERPFNATREALGHLHYFNATTALATMSEAGYRVQAFRYTAGALELPNRTMKRRVAGLPRRALGRVSPRWSARLLGGYSLLVLAEPS